MSNSKMTNVFKAVKDPFLGRALQILQSNALFTVIRKEDAIEDERGSLVAVKTDAGAVIEYFDNGYYDMWAVTLPDGTEVNEEKLMDWFQKKYKDESDIFKDYPLLQRVARLKPHNPYMESDIMVGLDKDKKRFDSAPYSGSN